MRYDATLPATPSGRITRSGTALICLTAALIGGIGLAGPGAAATEPIPLTSESIAESSEWRFEREVRKEEPNLHAIRFVYKPPETASRTLVGEFVMEREGKVVLRSRSRVTVRDGTATFEIGLPWEDARRTTFLLTETDDAARPAAPRVYRARINDFLIERYAE
jgi:hypothetical protein